MGNASQDNPHLTGIDININHIVFGMTRITDETQRDTGYLVPAWDFIGDITWYMQSDGADRSIVDIFVPI